MKLSRSYMESPKLAKLGEERSLQTVWIGSMEAFLPFP